MRRAAIVLIALLFVFTSAPATVADDGRIGGEPGNVHVVASDDIRMEAETVQAVMYGRFAEYVVDFRFVNSGPRQTVRLGFPFGLDDKTSEWPPVPLAGFLAYQDGTPLRVTITTGTDGPLTVGWFEHTATFPPGTTMIRVRYLTRPSVSAGISEEAAAGAPAQFAGMVCGTAWYPYTLHTGSGWAGTIGRAVIRYTLSPDFEGWGFGAEPDEEWWGTRPASFTRPDANTLQWVLEDFEPVQDANTGTSPFDVTALYYEPLYTGFMDEERAEWAKPPITEVRASSVSRTVDRDFGELLHPAELALYDPADSWISRDGDAEGAWLTLTTWTRRTVRELRIVPGYARTPSEYAEHGRPKRIEARFDDGTVRTIDLADEPTVQRFAVSATVGRSATLTVKDVYPGSAYDDVAISVIELGSAPAPEFLTFDEALAAEGAPQAQDPPPASGPETPAPEPTTTPDAGSDDRSNSPALPIAVALALVIGGGAVAARRRRNASIGGAD